MDAHSLPSTHSETARLTCKNCSYATSNFVSLFEHVEAKHTVHTCSICRIVERTEKRLTKHMMAVHKMLAKTHKCTKCEFVSQSELGLKKHVLYKHERIMDQGESSRHKVTTCHKCGQEFQSLAVMDIHMRTAHWDGMLKCRFCTYETKSEERLEEHMAELCQEIDLVDGCSGPPSLRCYRDDMDTRRDKIQWRANMVFGDGGLDNNEMRETRPQFSLLEAQTHPQPNLSQYLQQHDRNPIYECMLCGYKQARRERTVQHIQHSHPKHIAKYNCDKCAFSSTETTVFMQHLDQHDTKAQRASHYLTTDKKPPEDYVKKLYPDPEKYYHCSDCDYRCLGKHQLQLHVSRKHNVKTLACNRCDFRTKGIEQLREHRRKTGHEPDKKFTCSECEYATHIKRDLKMHVIMTHKTGDDKPEVYQCDSCKFTTLVKGSLFRHKQKHHRGGRR